MPTFPRLRKELEEKFKTTWEKSRATREWLVRHGIFLSVTRNDKDGMLTIYFFEADRRFSFFLCRFSIKLVSTFLLNEIKWMKKMKLIPISEDESQPGKTASKSDSSIRNFKKVSARRPGFVVHLLNYIAVLDCAESKCWNLWTCPRGTARLSSTCSTRGSIPTARPCAGPRRCTFQQRTERSTLSSKFATYMCECVCVFVCVCGVCVCLCLCV